LIPHIGKFFDLISAGMNPQEIIADYPEFELEDIVASLNYAKKLVSGDVLQLAN